jgi:uncharacterized membrane protein YhaH (DUF805 family)
VVAERLFLGILGLGIAAIVIAIIIPQKRFTNIHMLGWTLQIITIIGDLLFQMFVAALLIIFFCPPKKQRPGPRGVFRRVP